MIVVIYIYMTRSFSKARVISCLSVVVCCHACERKSGNQLEVHEVRYGEWLALHQVLIGNYMLGTMTKLLENVEHCGGEPEQADTGISCH